jgi:hypothetical protein
LSEAEIKLRALEREAKAQRDLLESYLARYRDASARHDMGAVPAQAAIVSRAHAAILPSFPKKVPITLLAAAATALLSLAYVLARELLAAPAVAREPSKVATFRDRRRRRSEPGEPAVATAAGSALSDNAAAAPPALVLPADSESHFVPVPQIVAEQAVLPLATKASGETAQQPMRFFRRRGDRKPAPAEMPVKVKTPSIVSPASQRVVPGNASSVSLLERLRRGGAPAESMPQQTASAPVQGWLARIRRAYQPEQNNAEAKAKTTEPKGDAMPLLRTNDLRHYLNQRLAAAAAEAADETAGKQKPVTTKTEEKIGPVLKSLDAVVNQIVAAGRGGAPRAVLIAGAGAKVDATREAIAIARSLVDRRERIVLADLTHGASAVSGPLELPRAPGFTDLLARGVGFEDVVQIDPRSALQVIPAGNPKLVANGDQNEAFTPIFEALMQAYDCVVLHADMEALRSLTPALKFEVPVVAAVLRAGTNPSSVKNELDDFLKLGCPVLLYEQDGKTPRSRLLGRVAAI